MGLAEGKNEYLLCSTWSQSTDDLFWNTYLWLPCVQALSTTTIMFFWKALPNAACKSHIMALCTLKKCLYTWKALHISKTKLTLPHSFPIRRHESFLVTLKRLCGFRILGIYHQLKKIHSLLKEENFERCKVNCEVRANLRGRNCQSSENMAYLNWEGCLGLLGSVVNRNALL